MCGNSFCFAYRLLSKQLGVPLAKSVINCLHLEWEKYLRLQTFDEFRRHMGPFRGQLHVKNRKWLEENPALYQLAELVDTLQGAVFSSKFELMDFIPAFQSEFLIFSSCCGGWCVGRFSISTTSGQVDIGHMEPAPRRFDSLVSFIRYWLDQTPDGSRRWCKLTESSSESDSD